MNRRALGLVGIAVVGLACSGETGDQGSLIRTVQARVQIKPGGGMEEVEMDVHPAATDLRIVSANEAGLEKEELVLGIVTDGHAVAYLIRYLALYEGANDRVGETALAPTW